ncbi:glycosyltransferase family protein [Desulfovibrio sp. SGI.169]|uniref:glycosyltransferase family protein n=1 Tax=Desulfovibrio sp. SGI.169 TaxID=3420561 RepID=UPI003CFC2CCA
MARVLYGIHGTGHGHAMRGLTIARRLSRHEFLFVGDDDAPKVLEAEFPVRRLPNLGTVFKNYKVDLGATIARAVPLLLRRRRYIDQVLRLMDEFRPDVCMTDLEYFVPRAAERAGLPCLTLDHQHIITCCRHNLPPDMWGDAFVQGLTPRYLFRPTAENLIISFYAPPVLPRYKARVAPPILRDSVLGLRPRDEGHVLVYQSNSTHRRLVDFLRAATDKTCYVYGYDRTEGREGNVVFMQKSEEGFLRLLEGCSYVIQGGGHTLMGEALYLGKPILTLPLKAMVEQRFNALYVERLGYGMQADMLSLEPELLRRFEARLPEFRAAIATGNFCGNEMVFGLVDHFIRHGSLPARGAPPVAES